MHSWLKQLSYIFFPRNCVLCGEIVLPSDELCETCEEYLRTVKPPSGDGIAAPFVYDAEIRNALLRLKFNGFRDCVPFFAEHIARILQSKSSETDAVCYVPLHNIRQASRGFNQSELLAKAVAERLGLALQSHALVRLRNTSSQREFDRDARLKNVDGAFAVPDGVSVKGLRLILIDDITTTGATLLECANTLKANGAAEIICAAAASTSLYVA